MSNPFYPNKYKQCFVPCPEGTPCDCRCNVPNEDFMMMLRSQKKETYVAYYIPCNEPIVDGDIVFVDRTIGSGYFPVKNGKAIVNEGVLEYDVTYLKPKKVKLTLCSNDLSVGDNFNTFVNGRYSFGKISKDSGDSWGVESSFTGVYVKKDEAFKIVGDISPNATWVKHGDRINEDDVVRHHICYDTPGNTGYCFHCSRSKGCDSEDYNYLIKGPCGHFH